MLDEKKAETSETENSPEVDPQAGEAKVEEPKVEEPKTEEARLLAQANAEAAGRRVEGKEKDKALARKEQENAELRAMLAKRDKEAADADKARKRESMEEGERLKAELADSKLETEEANQRVRDAALSNAVMAAAGDMDFISPGDAARLISKTGIAFDEFGTPNADQITSALESLKEASPHYIREEQKPPTPPAAKLPTGNNPPMRPSGPGALLKINASEEAITMMKSASAKMRDGERTTPLMVSEWMTGYEKLSPEMRTKGPFKTAKPIG